jgi:hypothetical protein
MWSVRALVGWVALIAACGSAQGNERLSVIHRLLQDFWHEKAAQKHHPSTPIPTLKPMPFQADDDTSLRLDTFDAFASRFDAIFVNYCSSTSGICHHVASEWHQFSEIALQLFEQRVGVAKVDCTKEPGLCQRKHIKNYPTLRWYGAHQVQTYHGVLSSTHFLHIAARNLNLTATVEHDEQGMPMVSILRT